LIVEHNHETTGKRRALEPLNATLENSKVVSDYFQGSLNKKLKSSDPDEVALVMESSLLLDHSFTTTSTDLALEPSNENQADIDTSNKLGSVINPETSIEQDEGRYIKDETEATQISGSQGCSEWKLLEKELYRKGLEIFGRNRYRFIFELPLGTYSYYTCIESL
jgi:hypothetical protein